jgi:hypothetical protein
MEPAKSLSEEFWVERKFGSNVTGQFGVANGRGQSKALRTTLQSSKCEKVEARPVTKGLAQFLDPSDAQRGVDFLL